MSGFTDPVTTFRAVVDALNQGDWHGATSNCDPSSLADFRDEILEIVAPTKSIHQLTVKDLLRGSPDMPRDVAEYQIRQFEKYRDSKYRLNQEFPNLQSVSELKSLDATEIFAKWLHAQSIQAQMKTIDSDVSLDVTSWSDEIVSPVPYPYFPVGFVLDGNEIAYVVYCIDFHQEGHGEADVSESGDLLSSDKRQLAKKLIRRPRPEIATCRRQPDGSWKLLAEYDFLRVGSTFVASDNE